MPRTDVGRGPSPERHGPVVRPFRWAAVDVRSARRLVACRSPVLFAKNARTRRAGVHCSLTAPYVGDRNLTTKASHSPPLLPTPRARPFKGVLSRAVRRRVKKPPPQRSPPLMALTRLVRQLPVAGSSENRAQRYITFWRYPSEKKKNRCVIQSRAHQVSMPSKMLTPRGLFFCSLFRDLEGSSYKKNKKMFYN